MNDLAVAALKDLARNIACLDETFLRTADVVLLRETLRDWRDSARVALNAIEHAHNSRA